MTEEEYVTTFTIDGKRVDVGMDDYGQCYFLEWEEDGKKHEVSLGTYNDEIVESVFFLLDPLYRHISNREYMDDFTEEEEDILKVYFKMFDEIERDMMP